MVERQYGRTVYESIVYRRRDPALLEMMEGNVFKMRVFPIFGRKEKRIIISYTQTLPELYGTLRYWFPMEHANDKAGELTIRVRVTILRLRMLMMLVRGGRIWWVKCLL